MGSEERNSIVELMIEDKKEIEIGKKKFLIGKLSIAQSIRLGSAIIKCAKSMSSDMKDQIKDGESDVEDILTLFDCIKESEMIKIVGILLSESDSAWLMDNINAENLTEIVALTLEKNDLTKILGNVQRAMEALTRKAQVSPLPS